MTNGRQKWNISKSLCSRKSAGFTADHNQDFFLLTCGNGSMLDFNSPSLPPGSRCRRWCQTESQRNSGSSTSSNLQKKKKSCWENKSAFSRCHLRFLKAVFPCKVRHLLTCAGTEIRWVCVVTGDRASNVNWRVPLQPQVLMGRRGWRRRMVNGWGRVWGGGRWEVYGSFWS